MVIIRADAYCDVVLFECGGKLTGTGADFPDCNLQICACALMTFLLSALAGERVGFSSDFPGVEEIAARGVLLPSLESVHNFVQSVRFVQIMSNCTANPVKHLLGYSLWAEFYCLYERYLGWFPNKTTSGEHSSLPPRSICGQERATLGSSINRKVDEVLVGLRESLLLMMSEARSAAEAAGVQLYEPVSLHPDIVSEGGID